MKPLCKLCEKPARSLGLCVSHYCKQRYQKIRRVAIAKTTKWAQDNQEKRREICRKYREANREKTRESVLRSHKKHPDRIKQWNDANRDKVREIKRAWVERNPEFVSLKSAVNKSRRRAARPPWVDVSQIASIQRDARRISAETGVQHHVDHIVPLVHPAVCGLDVPWNLQIIPALDNAKKYNKLIL